MIIRLIFIVITTVYLSGCGFGSVFGSRVSDTDDSYTAIETDSLNNGLAFEVDEPSIIALVDPYTLASPTTGDWALTRPGVSNTVTLTSSTSTLAENSGTTVTLTATSSTTSTSDITVTLATTGTATDGTDYSAVNGTTITISAGATTGTKTFTITDDSLTEGDETVIVAISSVSNATENGTQSVTITITDNESPTVTLASSVSSLAENSGTTVTLTATSSTTSTSDITVTLATTGTATDGTDYSAVNGTTITISAGATTGTKTFTITDDSVYENDETVIVAISSVSNATESGTQSVTVTITENESSPTVQISSSAASVYDNGSSLTITATSSQAADEAISVVIGASGTSTEGTDYATVSDITISAGSTTGTATFNPTADTVNEGSETAIIAISSVSGADSSKGSTTSVTITINEYALRTGTAFTEGTSSEQNTIKGRSSWTTVDQSSHTVHPYELFNLHKVHSFSSGGTSLTGVGQTIYISDSALHTNHDSFDGKTITMLDNPSASTTAYTHGTHVASIAAGIVGEVTQGVAPDASLVFSDFQDNATNRASDLDTARTSHSAVAANHSWGYSDSCVGGTCYSSVTMTELEAAASAGSRNVREQLSYQYWGGATPTSTYITALDNFQNSGVIVFANGNYSSDTDASFMGALPYYFNGTDDSVDLSDAWLSIMYSEFTGSSLSGASTSDFNRLGNPCGKAKEWCLVVDDKDIGAAGYVNSGGTSIWQIAGGSSMGAPQVSGGVALMAQAFPNHTPEQLVDRILASANNAWFTPDGNTTFTTHGNSITHGYNSTWGQGVPDFYAALSPITSSANPAMAVYTGESIQSSEAQSFTSSSITSSASFGDAIYQGLIGETGYAYDALSGGFKYDMATHVNMTNKEAPSINLSSELSKLDFQLSGVNNPSWKTNFDQVVSNLHKSDNQEVRLTLGASSLPVQSFFDFNSNSPDNLPDFNTPYLEAGEGGIGMGATYQLHSSRLLLGTTIPFEYNNGQIIGNRKTLAGSLEYGDPSVQSLTLMAGYTQDNDNLLGSTGTEAFSLAGSSSNTRFAALKARKQLNDDISLVGMATLANTDMTSPSNSFVNSASNVKSSSFSISANKKNLFGDDSITLNIKQPNLVSNGNLSIRLSNLADSNGNLSYHNKNINLRPSAKQLDYTVSYRKDLDEELGFSIKHLLTSNLNHNQDSDVFSSSYIGLKYKDLKLGFNINSFDFSKNTDLTYLHRF